MSTNDICSSYNSRSHTPSSAELRANSNSYGLRSSEPTATVLSADGSCLCDETSKLSHECAIKYFVNESETLSCKFNSNKV